MLMLVSEKTRTAPRLAKPNFYLTALYSMCSTCYYYVSRQKDAYETISATQIEYHIDLYMAI